MTHNKSLFNSSLHAYHRGFTLIELLIVVAIMATIAALLLPSIGMAQSVAKQTACLSNLRQMGMASLAYQDDNNGLYVRFQVYGDTAKAVYGDCDLWYLELMKYFDRGTSRDERLAMNKGTIKSVLKGCPSFKNDKEGAWGWRFGYAMNHRLGLPENGKGSYYYGGLANAGAFTDFNSAAVTHVSSRVVFGCSYNIRFEPKGTVGLFRYSEHNAERCHRGRANYAFCDNHVATHTPEQAWYGVVDPGRSGAP